MVLGVNQTRRLQPKGWLAWNDDYVVTGNTKEEALARLAAAELAEALPQEDIRAEVDERIGTARLNKDSSRM